MRVIVGIICFIIELIVLFIVVWKTNLINYFDVDKRKQIFFLILIIIGYCCLTYNEIWHDLSSNLTKFKSIEMIFVIV